MVDFDPIPGVTQELRLVVAHVGGGRGKEFKAALAEQSSDAVVWVIADSLPAKRIDRWRYLGWKATLAESLDVHRAWLEALTRQGA